LSRTAQAECDNVDGMKGKGLLAAGVVILAAIGAGALSVLRQAPKNQAPPAEVKQAAPADVTMPARLQAQTVVDVGVAISGKIEAFHAEPGAEVYEGQLLAQIRSEALGSAEEHASEELERAQARINNLESTIAAARLESSRAMADAARVRADLDRASRRYQREKMLLSEGATPRLTFEKAEREFRALESESAALDQVAKQSEERVDTSQRELDQLRKILQDKVDDLEAAKARVAAGDIYSPVSGLVSNRQGTVGDEVNPAMKDIFQIATDLTVLEAVAEPNPADLARIKPGQEAFVALAESPNELLPGVVKRVEAGRVTIEFKNPDASIRPGLTAQVRIKLT
jgi:multidrug resistance efflux pump